MKKIIIIFFVWVIFLNTINKLSFLLLKDSTSYELPKSVEAGYRFWIAPWLNFDGRNYLEIVLNGYQSAGQKVDLRVFFPLYPTLIKVLSLNLLINPIYVGLGLSLVSSLLSLMVFNQLLIQERVGKGQRLKSVFLILLFPTSFYFAGYYTESLFLFFSLLTFYFLNRKNIGLAGFFSGLVLATRITGLAIIPPIIWASYQRYKETKRISMSMLTAALMYLIFFLYFYLTTNNIFSFVAKHENWGRRVNLLSPLTALWNSLTKLLLAPDFFRHGFHVYSIEILEFLSAIFLLTIIFSSYKKIKFVYWLYIVSHSLIIFYSGQLGSITRFLAVIFPIFIFLGKSLSNKCFYTVCVICFLILIYLSALFFRGYWVA